MLDRRVEKHKLERLTAMLQQLVCDCRDGDSCGLELKRQRCCFNQVDVHHGPSLLWQC